MNYPRFVSAQAKSRSRRPHWDVLPGGGVGRSLALLLASIVLLVSAPASARVSAPAGAGESSFHPELTSALDEVVRAQGPETYTALRSLWSTYDRADPTRVEAALRWASESPLLAAPEQAYANLLVAYARERRGDPHGADRLVRGLGFIDHWAVVGPFDNDGKVGLTREFEPERLVAEAIVPGRAFSGKERPVRWRSLPAAFRLGWLDFGSLMRPESHVCAYAISFVQLEAEAEAEADKPLAASLWMGASGAFRAYWNGKLVLEDAAYRGHDVDRMAAAIDVRPGVNSLLIKACGDTSAPVVSARIADTHGRRAAPVTFSGELELSAQAVESFARDARAPAGVRVQGPLQAFEQRAAKGSNPQQQEAYAEFLVATAADDPVTHQARDLATRAAEASPTLDNCLLAARLAEDRNGHRRWLARARENLAERADAHAELLLAEADLLRESPQWRQSLPLYKQALRRDPFSVEAVESLVALYNQVQLHRTALAVIRNALRRQPDSVRLLRQLAAQLRLLGRSVEALEAENRYAAYRFDDTGFLAAQIDLAVERADEATALRWLDRLLALTPTSLWTQNYASTTYRRLGKSERALASLERALALAPEDVGTLRALADLRGTLGQRDRQRALLQRLLSIRPQEREVREYVDYLEPATAKEDEAYAWESERFLAESERATPGFNRRTLRDLTVTTVYDNGLSSKFRQVVFQPLNDTAAAMARQYAFHYQADRQLVQLRGARVYRKDGRVDEAIEYGEGAADDPEISMYTSGRTFYVQFPRLEAGDVVELRYRIDDTSAQNLFADYFGEIVYLQSDDPTFNAEYVLITPTTRQLNVDVKLAGVQRTKSQKGQRQIQRFTADEIPALSPEPEMPPWPEVAGFIHVSTYDSWKALGRWYWGLIKDQFELDDATRALAHRLAEGKATEREKVEAVYQWVIGNTRYVALEFGIYGYKPRRCVQTVARGWGDCKDKATVIVALLRELGIDSTLVVLRTQMRGAFRSKIPSLEPFDHAIAYVPSLDLYLDGTAELTGVDELPVMDQGALGLLVNQGDAKLVKLPYAKAGQSVVSTEVKARLDKQGGAKLSIAYDVRGSEAPGWRRQLGAESTRRERVAELLARHWPAFELADGGDALDAEGLQDPSRPVALRIRGSAPGFARLEGGRLSAPVTLGQRLTPKFASLSRRRTDVLLFTFPEVRDHFSITLPSGARVVSAPKDAQGTSRFGSYSVQFQQQGDTLLVDSHLLLTQPRVAPADYDAFRAFCAEADEALAQRLVLEP